MTTTDQDERIRSLEQFANASTVPQLPVAPSVGNIGAERVVGAQQVAVHRDEVRILQKLAAMGAAAGEHWYYRYPVKNRRKGTTDWIEGPSIKLANDLGRIYGNCEIQTRVIDLGTSWMIYARFNDFETGYALERPFQQGKGASKMGGDDDARRLDIALQIGVSKAIRNVTTNALQTFADHAFEAAKESLVKKIGANIQAWRDRVVQGLSNHNIELVRVELVLGRAAKDWTAPDIAKVIAMMKAIADGMATVDETFPPRDGDKKEAVDQQTGEVLDKFAAKDEVKTETAPAETSETVDAGNNETQESQQQESPSPSRTAVANDAGVDATSRTDSTSASTNSSDGPTNDATYTAYAEAWIDGSTNAEECAARWSREKTMRNKCNVSPENRDALDARKKAKVAQLKSKN